MDDLFNEVAKSLGLSCENSIIRRLEYLWLEGCKYIHFHNCEVSHKNIGEILSIIGEDGKTHPFSSNYLIIVVAETSDIFERKDLYFMRESGEHVAFVLYNKATNQVFFPHGFVFPPRFSYQRIAKTIAKKLLS